MDKTSNLSVLLTKGLEIAPRVLSHQDRNMLSRNFGYFDRRYWAWKNAAMPDASNMHALYYLALLWFLKSRHNPYYKNDYIQDAIASGIEYWLKLQHKDGSFDQIFPNEHSVGATSYTVLAVLKTKEILGNNIDVETTDRMMQAIEKAGNFLLFNDETYGVISNHIALFAYTFDLLYRHTGKLKYQKKANSQIRVLLENMSAEGWFMEYNGADPGYQTQCTYYLAQLFAEGYDELKKPLDVSIANFLPYFVHPDGSLGGYYGCRNTALVYPAGLAILAKTYPQANRMLELICRGIIEGNSPSPDFLDFPNAFRLGCNYLIAWQYLKENGQLSKLSTDNSDYRLPWEEENIDKKFNDAGIHIKGTKTYYAIIGLKKGGVIKIFDKMDRTLSFDHCGYTVSAGKKNAATQGVSTPETEVNSSGIKVIHPFFVVSQLKMTPLLYLIILALGLSIFRVKWVRELFKKMLVGILITKKTKTLGHCERKIIFSRNTVNAIDKLRFSSTKSIRNLRAFANHTTYHMASADFFDFSRFCQKRELLASRIPPRGVNVTYKFDFSTNGKPEICIVTDYEK
jgi:hypothetical protein